MMRVTESRCSAKQTSSTACRWSTVADVLAVAVSSIHAYMVYTKHLSTSYWAETHLPTDDV